MSKDVLRLHLRARLNTIGGRIAAAERRHDDGPPEERVKAAGQLAVLKRRKAEVEARLVRLDDAPETAWESIKTEIEADIDAIAAAVERAFVGI